MQGVVVAPYEADAQLAWLYKQQKVDFVISEDSDLLAFGVKKVFFKMDHCGLGQEVDMDRINEVECFKDFNEEMLLVSVIFSGCDYLPSIPGIGLKKSVKLVDQAGKDETFLECMTILRADRKITIPEKYEKKFMKAFLTFKFQRVYNTQFKKLTHLTDPSQTPYKDNLEKFKSLDFLGQTIEDELATNIANGDACPLSKEMFPSDENELFVVQKVVKSAGYST